MARKILIGIAGLAGLIVVAALVAPMLIPVSTFKPTIEAEASKAIGRTVVIGDDISLSVLPRVQFKVNDLVVANAEGMQADAFASVEEAAIGVGLLPLLGGAVEVDRFVLKRPVINLEKTVDGRVNWELGGASEPSAPAGTSSGGGDIKDLRLGDVAIVDGEATFIDGEAGTAYEMRAVNLDIGLDSLSAPLVVKGGLQLNGRPVRLDATVDSLRNLQNGERAEIEVKAKIDDADISIAAATNAGETLSYAGDVSVVAPSVRSLMEWFDIDAPTDEGFERLELSGDMQGNETSFAFDNAKVLFDAIAGEGALSVNWAGVRPALVADLSVGRLDLRPYLPEAPKVEGEGAAKAFPAWSKEQIDLSGLKSADATVEIKTDAILVDGLKIDQSALALSVDNGRLVADLKSLALYDGAGAGRFIVNARGARPSYAAQFDLKSLAALAFLKDAAGIESLTGTGALSFDVSANGASQDAIVKSLAGGGSFSVVDGAIVGVNLAQAARALQAFRASRQAEDTDTQPQTNAEETAPSNPQQTDFAEFGAVFSISQGALNAENIKLLNPYLRLTGGGAVNLPEQTLDLRLTPRLVSSAQGQGGAADASGIGAPLKITGNFNKINVALDLETAAKDKARDVLTDRLNKAFGGDEEREDGEKSPGEALVEEGLRQLFGRQ